MWICIAQGSACSAVFPSNLSPAVKAFTPKGDSSKDVNILGCLLLMLWNRFTPGRLHTQVSWPDFRWKGSIECKLRDSGDLAMGRCLGNNRQKVPEVENSACVLLRPRRGEPRTVTPAQAELGSLMHPCQIQRAAQKLQWCQHFLKWGQIWNTFANDTKRSACFSLCGNVFEPLRIHKGHGNETATNPSLSPSQSPKCREAHI